VTPQESAVRSGASFLVQAYRTALWLYPPGFRGEFGDELARDFGEALTEAQRSGGWRDILQLLASVGSDLMKTIVVQWARTGAPILALIAVGVAAVMTSAAATIGSEPRWAHAVRPEDQELMTVMLLIGAVLLVIVVTIFFTLYFLRPKRLRRRV
jgi:hypothetical protein